jgi:hypothetical protein
MAFTTNIPSHVLLGEEGVIFGTVELASAYGEVRSATVAREADLVEIENNVGGLKAAILSKPRFELEMEVVFDAAVALPELGGSIALPFAGLRARILGGIQIKWSNKAEKMVSFKATHWDSMAVETTPGSGIFTNAAYSVDLTGATTPIA